MSINSKSYVYYHGFSKRQKNTIFTKVLTIKAAIFTILNSCKFFCEEKKCIVLKITCLNLGN